MILFYRQGNWDTGKLSHLSSLTAGSRQSPFLTPGSLDLESIPSYSAPSLESNTGGQHFEWTDAAEAVSTETGNSMCSVNGLFIGWTHPTLWIILPFLSEVSPGSVGKEGSQLSWAIVLAQVLNRPSHRVMPFIFKHTHTSSVWWQVRVVSSALWFGIRLI